MDLPSYTCDLCILQKEETLEYLFLKCNFTKNCWASLGLQVPRRMRPLQVLKCFKTNMNVPFFMEIIVLMAWSSCTGRNDWIFNEVDPKVESCKSKFIHEFALMFHRVKKSYFPQIHTWLDSIVQFLLVSHQH
uniref:Reverse transcriptase zinc-binding domain-containing protein n=1 Tax=Arundo donax TaxID=35708 RepID=A0A0A9AB73_ARUDO